MFTGIIERIVLIKHIEKSDRGLRFGIEYDNALDPIRLGESVAINGVCLTAASVEKNEFWVEAVQETLKVTTLSQTKLADFVNLERSLKVGDRVGGHFVFGHVDGVADVHKIEHSSDSHVLTIGVPVGCGGYIVEKGSVAIDGVSLTIQQIRTDSFTVAIIPHTAKVTTLGTKRVGGQVNLEADMLAKYALKTRPEGTAFPFTTESLEKFGF